MGSSGLAAVLLWRKSRYTWLGYVVLFLFLGAVRYAAVAALPADDISRHCGEVGEVSGRLRAAPRVTKEAAGSSYFRYEVDIDGFRPEGGAMQPASGGLFIYERRRDEGIIAQAGDRIRALGKVRLPSRYNNPGQIDTPRCLRAQGITARLSARQPGAIMEPGEEGGLQRWADDVRRHYLSSLASVMPPADAAALFALLFGGYEGIKPELTEAFAATGIVHILSVSGSHISLLAAVMGWLGSFLRLPRPLTGVLVISGIVFYSLLAGCVPPVLRSAIMGILTFAALVLEREKEARRLLTITGLGMLLYQPFLLFDISFQLSFAATAGLLYLTPRLREWMAGWPEFLRGGISLTLGAQLATLPFLAWYFHQISLSALLANLTVVPVLEFMIIAGLLAGVLILLLPLAGRLLFGLDSILLGLVYESSRLLAELPGGVLHLPPLGLGAGGLYYAALILWSQETERRHRLWDWLGRERGKILPLAGVVLLGAFLWQISRPQEMAVHFIDVHQGNAALITTPHGRAFMIDTGGVRGNAFDVGSRVDLPYLAHYGVRRLDFLLLTHAHEDHAGGAGSLLRRIPIGFIWTGHEPRLAYAQSLGPKVQAADLEKLTPAQEGAAIELDGVRVEVLYAPEAVAAQTGNEYSNVYRVSYGEVSFLFTGDLVQAQEAALLGRGNQLQSTVLQVGHHGSDTSSSPAFVAAVRPAWAVFSVGADNSFGHPKPQVVQRFMAAGASVCRTDEDGAVVFRTDGQHISVERYRDRFVFW